MSNKEIKDFKYTVNTTVKTDDGAYQLSALLKEDGSYCMVSLEVPVEVDKDLYWDNEDYLLYSVLPFLKKNKSVIKDKEDKSYRLIPKDRRKEVKGILKQGIRLGFFKDYE